MKKILISLLLAVSLLALSACGASTDSTPSDTSASDVSASDASASDISATDALKGLTPCELGKLYFCYPDSYTTDASATDMVTVYANKKTGANFTATKAPAVDMVVSELSRTDLDAIGEKGANELESILGAGVDAVYTYGSHGTALEGKGVYFSFDISVNYTELDYTQNYSYYQMYIGDGKDVYMLTFATNTYSDTAAEVYFADVIKSITLK